MKDALGTMKRFVPRPGADAVMYSLPALERSGFGAVSRLPVTLRVVLESVLRNVDGERVTERDVRELVAWQPRGQRNAEVPFVVSRVLLQDFTGVPLLVDLAALRSAIARAGGDSLGVAPRVPVDLVIDHSVQVDHARVPGALRLNMDVEMERNLPRYEFLKWATGAFAGLRIVPPGVGICHQVNLEHLAGVAIERGGVWSPDTLVGTDSHTPMVNGIGVLGWGVGGIEAEAAMLGEPVHLLVPDVVGVHLTGALLEGVTATDLVLRVTELLRRTRVVGKFVEFFGDGAASLGAPERATVANMAPEYGATVGYFPVDDETCRYLLATGREPDHVAAVKSYLTEPAEFNSYGARRGNHHVMIRGTFANPRIRNLLVPGVEGGWTILQPSGRRASIDEAAREYATAGTPLVVFAGAEYGSGSSRDWAAKGTALLGVRAVVARSFERIHRSNLVMMGVLPCELPEGADPGLDGGEMVDIGGLARLVPRGEATVHLRRRNGTTAEVQVRVRIDTPVELELYRHGGILPYVYRKFLEGT